MSINATIQLQDLALIYTKIAHLPGRLHAPRRTAQQVIVPGRAGATITQLLSSGAREMSMTGYIFAETFLITDRQLSEDALKELAYHCRVTIHISDGSNAPRMIEGYCTNLSIDPRGLTLLSPSSDVTINFVAEPFWRDHYPRQYAISATPKEIVLGSAPSSPILRIMGAATPVVDPIFTACRMSGEVVGSIGFDISLTDDDYVEHDFNTGITRKSVDGTVTEDSSIAVLGNQDLFFAFEPRHGNRQLDAWPTARLSSTSGTPTGELQYTRAWL